MCNSKAQHDGSAMHVWMPTNKMWVLARPAKNGSTGDNSLKRGRERFEQPTATTEDLSHASRRAVAGHARHRGSKRPRTAVPSDAVPEPADPPPGSAVASLSPSPSDVPPASLPPPGPADAARAGDSHVVHSMRAKPPSLGTAQAGSSDDADDGFKPQPGGAKQAALRVAVAAGERESERYTGFELVEELTQEQLAEAADELYEPLPTCPICALLPALMVSVPCLRLSTHVAFVCRAKREGSHIDVMAVRKRAFAGASWPLHTCSPLPRFNMFCYAWQRGAQKMPKRVSCCRQAWATSWTCARRRC